MTKELFVQAIIKFLLGLISVGMLVFIPAGSLSFKNGWIFMVVLFVPMFIAGFVLMYKNPELLKRRLNGKEKLGEQSLVIKLSGLMFLMGFIVAGLGYRYNWYMLPDSAVTAATAVFLISYILYGEVLRENTYLSRTIEVSENQKVIDTGMYAVVRHPMYTVTITLFMSMPLILGSVYAFIIFLAYPLIIVKRIKSEELFLEKELEGYREYKNKVKYRLIPYIW